MVAAKIFGAVRLNAPWWFWNLFGEQAVFLLSRREGFNGGSAAGR